MKSSTFLQIFYKIREELIKYPEHLPSALSQLPIIIYLVNNILTNRSKFNLSIGKVFGSNAWYFTMKYFNIPSEFPAKILHGNYFDFCDTTLGNSLGVSIGLYLANKKKTINILTDSQFQIGTIIEALQFIGKNQIPIQIIVDWNNQQLLGDLNVSKKSVIDILKSLNIIVIELDYFSLDKLKDIETNNKPTCFIVNTIKGFTIKELENDPVLYHGTNNLKKYTVRNYEKNTI